MKKSERLNGIIDIGAHAVRLYIGQTVCKGEFKIIESLWLPIAAGKDTFSQGIISNDTISELIKSLENFKTVLKSYKVANIKVVATSALREASNSNIVVDRVLNATEMKIEIIDPLEETEIVYKSIKGLFRKSIDFELGDVFIFILGAGNTYVIYQHKGSIIYSDTYHIGTLRLQKVYTLHYDSYRVFIESMVWRIYKVLTNFKKDEAIAKFIVLNDDVLGIVQTSDKIEADRSNVFRLSKKSFLNLYENICRMNLKEIQETYKIDDNIIHTAFVAFLLTGKLYEFVDAKEIIFPRINLASALLWQYSMLGKTEITKISEDTRKNIISSAMALGEKYHFN